MLNEVLAVAFLSDLLFVIVSFEDHVYVYNWTSVELKYQLNYPEFRGELRGLATCYIDNYLYVADQLTTEQLRA